MALNSLTESDINQVNQIPVTFERLVIKACIHSFQFFQEVKDRILPILENGLARPIFATPRYHSLIEAVSHCWSMVGDSASMISQKQLHDLLVDENNSYKVNSTVVQELLEELDMDIYDAPPDEDLWRAVRGPFFDHWVSTRLAQRALEQVNRKSKECYISFEEIDEVMEPLRSLANPVSHRTARLLSDLIEEPRDPNDELLKHRYLCRQGGALLVGPTGIGKSAISMQMAICFALGRPCFGIEPNGCLRSLFIQAENDDGDICEMVSGVCDGLQLNESERLTAMRNILIIREDSKTSKDFFKTVVAPQLRLHKPDMLWIDPALSYLGGDVICQKDVGAFLRNQLNPLLAEHNCGCVIIHHTNKPVRANQKTQKANDFAYEASGSAEWCNWARAVIVIRNVGSPDVFELNAAKRGGRLRWTAADKKTRIYAKHISHSTTPGQIFWSEADPSDLDAHLLETLIGFVPEDECIPKNDLIEFCRAKGIGGAKARKLIDNAVDKEQLFEWKVKRSGVRDQVLLGRKPQPSTC